MSLVNQERKLPDEVKMKEAIANCEVEFEWNKQPTSQEALVLDYYPLTFSVPLDDESWCGQHGLKDFTDPRRDSYAPMHLAQHLSFINRKVITWSNFFKVFTIYFLAMCLSHLISPTLLNVTSSSSGQLWQRNYIGALPFFNDQSSGSSDDRRAWAAGRLGRVRSDSLLSTQSELNLLSGADWNTRLVLADTKAGGFVATAENPQTPSRNYNPKMPLPLRQRTLFLSSSGILIPRVRRSYPRRLASEPEPMATELARAE